MANMETNGSRTPTTLQPPPYPLTVGSRHMATGERTLNITCPKRFFTSTTCTVSDEYGELLFKFEIPAPLKSYSVRRTLIDASTKQPLLIVRHPNSKIHTTAVETESGTQLCLLKDHGKSVTTQTAQVHFGECYETIDIQDDHATGMRTLYKVQGRTVAELDLLVDDEHINSLSRQSSDSVRSAWKLRMADGVDMALFVALAFARAEITHSFRR